MSAQPVLGATHHIDNFHAGGTVRSRPADGGDRHRLSAVHVPAGWPDEVRPPEVPDWELSAVGFLLDCCPSEYRGHPVLRRHPVVLARLAAEVVESQAQAARSSLVAVRAQLDEFVVPAVLDETIEVLQSEGVRLGQLRRSVMLVEEALRGRVFIKTL